MKRICAKSVKHFELSEMEVDHINRVVKMSKPIPKNDKCSAMRRKEEEVVINRKIRKKVKKNRMYIKKLQLQNFKRFTDLTIDLCPNGEEVPKLVLLIGQNGCGKSSIFDAFSVKNTIFSDKIKLIRDRTRIRRMRISISDRFDREKTEEFNKNLEANYVSYFNKQLKEDVDIFGNTPNNPNNNPNFTIKIGDENYLDKSYISNFKFYGRTAFRYVPQIDVWGLGNARIEQDKRMLEEEKDIFEGNVDNLFDSFLKALETQNLSIIQDYQKKINEGFSSIFGTEAISLKYKSQYSPITTVSPVRFTFSKGECEEIDYSLLSAGEKMVFVILFDLYNNVLKLRDTVIYYDELDLHLNTAIQYNLLKEITENWIDDSCQFWTASHSLGFIDYAREYEKGAIIDFDSLDFDQQQTLEPKKVDNLDIYDIAIPKRIIGDILKDKKIILCENKNAEFYNNLGIDKCVFVAEKDKDTIIKNLANSNFYGLIDRDYLADFEKNELQKNRLRVLNYYTFENYLYHPENVLEVYPDFDKKSYIQEITESKNKQQIQIGGSMKGRSKYICFKNKEIKDGDETIAEELYSNNFETFYKHFNMNPKNKKGYFDMTNYSYFDKNKLSQTNWFKEQIENILK